jgi:GntR family transcriptional regulator/MocR family aminotransferase
MLLLTIDRKSAVPVYRQIIDRVVHLVDGGTLSPGDRLPSSRILARSTGIHRSSVTRAYEELWALGYLESRPGSYSTIRRRARRLTGVERAQPLLDWSAKVVPAARGARESSALLSRDRPAKSDSRVLDFSRLTADVQLTPRDAVRRCFKAVLREDAGQALQYGEPAGYHPLRETIALRLRTHGVDVTPEEIVVTGGAQQALDLLLRALARPGDRIVVESPTYSVALHLFRFHGLDLQSIPVRPQGMDLDALEQALAGQRPALLYTIPNFHNPTGITTNQVHRERLLALCEKHRLPLVEDGFEEEMKYFGKAVLPIKSMDRRDMVAYVGTLSKVVFPGLRIGWIAAPRPLADSVQAIQRLCSLSGNHLAQAAVHRFFATGAYEAHLRRVHKTYRRRMQAMIDGLRENLPRRGVSWTEPQGGYTLWLQVSGTKLAEQALHDRLLAAGVKLSSGRLFHAHAPRHPCFRVSICCSTADEISEGCRRIGRVLRAAVEG